MPTDLAAVLLQSTKLSRSLMPFPSSSLVCLFSDVTLDGQAKLCTTSRPASTVRYIRTTTVRGTRRLACSARLKNFTAFP